MEKTMADVWERYNGINRDADKESFYAGAAGVATLLDDVCTDDAEGKVIIEALIMGVTE